MPEHLTEIQKFLYCNICLDHAIEEKNRGMSCNAHYIIRRGFAEDPDPLMVGFHLQDLVNEKSRIFGIHILLAELRCER